MWFLRWIPYAIEHVVDPFVTDQINAPAGVNLMWNSSITLISLALAPGHARRWANPRLQRGHGRIGRVERVVRLPPAGRLTSSRLASAGRWCRVRVLAVRRVAHGAPPEPHRPSGSRRCSCSFSTSSSAERRYSPGASARRLASWRPASSSSSRKSWPRRPSALPCWWPYCWWSGCIGGWRSGNPQDASSRRSFLPGSPSACSPPGLWRRSSWARSGSTGQLQNLETFSTDLLNVVIPTQYQLFSPDFATPVLRQVQRPVPRSNGVSRRPAPRPARRHRRHALARCPDPRRRGHGDDPAGRFIRARAPGERSFDRGPHALGPDQPRAAHRTRAARSPDRSTCGWRLP